jgi:hypothetical protein
MIAKIGSLIGFTVMIVGLGLGDDWTFEGGFILILLSWTIFRYRKLKEES